MRTTCQTSDGRNKVPYATLLEALKSAKSARAEQIHLRRQDVVSAVYRCSGCEQYHQTHVNGELVATAKNGIRVQVGFGTTPKQAAQAKADAAALGM